MVQGNEGGPTSAGRRRRVLVIEDNVDAAESLRDALELDEHVVQVAFDGRRGLDTARAFRPDVIVCDIGLPGMTGYEVAQAVRADPNLRTAKLIALTGYTSVDDVEKSREAGFDRHLSKPPSIEALEAMLAD